MDRRRSPGQRAGLTRARVLAAAQELLSEGGLDGLTMRSLADRLGVTPNALYSHVPSKTTLIDELLDTALAPVQTPAPASGDPAAGLHLLMASTYDLLLGNPDLVPLYLARRGARGPVARHLGDVVLALLAEGDVSGVRAQEALRVLIVYTIGFAAFAAQPALDPDQPPLPGAEELRGNFDSGLRWLLAGIISS